MLPAVEAEMVIYYSHGKEKDYNMDGKWGIIIDGIVRLTYDEKPVFANQAQDTVHKIVAIPKEAQEGWIYHDGEVSPPEICCLPPCCEKCSEELCKCKCNCEDEGMG